MAKKRLFLLDTGELNERKKNRNKESELEILCPFIGHCTENNSRDKEKCRNGYFDCHAFYNNLKEEIEKYDIPKLESGN